MSVATASMKIRPAPRVPGACGPPASETQGDQDERQQEAYHGCSLRLCARATSQPGGPDALSPYQGRHPRRFRRGRRRDCRGSGSAAPRPAAPLTVHEWGTFTSIAGEDGRAVQWLPQGGRSDLPCFVERGGFNIKGLLWGTVRMETPVLYFYSPRDVTVNVKLGFRQGAITEWYPHAITSLAWAGRCIRQHDRVERRARVTAPGRDVPGRERSPATTTRRATPTRRRCLAGPQAEKFLFYRGVGQFAPPIGATVEADGKVVVSTPDGTPIGDVILFENRRGATAYDVRTISTGRATLDRPKLDDVSVTPQRDLVRILVARGLYEKEAQAMVDTWSDSWFEEGARLLYIAPPAFVDAMVPLTITPAPSAVARVFVGRMELVTPVTRRDVRLALATDDRRMLQTYGRFLKPIADRVLTEVSPLDRELLAARLKAVAASWEIPTSSCR